MLFIRRVACLYRTTGRAGLKAVSVCHSKAITPRPSASEIALNKKIISTKSIKSLLELLGSLSESMNTVNRVAILRSIAKIVKTDGIQQEVLKQERHIFLQQQPSVYRSLLDSISDRILQCEHRLLANIMWALGKIQEKDHHLAKVCEDEILSYRISSFSSGEIFQILNGCSSLGLIESEIFSYVENAVLSKLVLLSDFKCHELVGVLISFSKTGNGSEKLYEHFKETFFSRGISKLETQLLSGFAWSFAKRGIYSSDLFSWVEKEIHQWGLSVFTDGEVVMLLWAFARAGKGNMDLFTMFDNEFIARGVKKFNPAELVQILWAFGRTGMKEVKMIELVRESVSDPGMNALFAKFSPNVKRFSK